MPVPRIDSKKRVSMYSAVVDPGALGPNSAGVFLSFSEPPSDIRRPLSVFETQEEAIRHFANASITLPV